MVLLMYAATSRFANRCLRGGGVATIGSPLKFGLRKRHVRFTSQERTSFGQIGQVRKVPQADISSILTVRTLGRCKPVA
jgi:hypothetical protein